MAAYYDDWGYTPALYNDPDGYEFDPGGYYDDDGYDPTPEPEYVCYESEDTYYAEPEVYAGDSDAGYEQELLYEPTPESPPFDFLHDDDRLSAEEEGCIWECDEMESRYALNHVLELDDACGAS